MCYVFIINTNLPELSGKIAFCSIIFGFPIFDGTCDKLCDLQKDSSFQASLLLLRSLRIFAAHLYRQHLPDFLRTPSI